jgi:hypothetical protein
MSRSSGSVFSATRRPLLDTRYVFILAAESIPGIQCGRKEYINKNSSDTIRNLTRYSQLAGSCLNHVRHRPLPAAYILVLYFTRSIINLGTLMNVH